MKLLSKLYADHKGKVSDKWSLYLDIYDELLMTYRHREISMLEIGIQNGGSLEIWGKFFPKIQSIIGCDIDPRCGLLSYENENIHVIVGDANSKESMDKILKISSNFEIIIDDGSHTSGDIVKSFVLYFPLIKEGGIFIAEDLHCSYWMQYEGGIYHPYSSIAFFKKLADIVNYQHWGNEKSRSDLLKGFFSRYSCSLDEEMLSQIYSIEFFNSICVVKKSSSEKNSLGARVVVGSQDSVSSKDALAQGHKYKIDPGLLQLSNSWSSRDLGPDEVIEGVEKLLREFQDNAVILNQKLANAVILNQKLAEREAVIAAIYNSISWRITSPLRRISYYASKINSRILFIRQRILSVSGLGIFDSLLKKYKAIKISIKYRIASEKKIFLRITSPIYLIRKVIFVLKNDGVRGLKNKISKITTTGFNERAYLLGRPDVKKAVARGDFVSGLEHFLIFGAAEGAVANLDYYSGWVSRYEINGDEFEGLINRKLQNFHLLPLISVVMPTYNTNVEWLIEAIESVRQQSYPHWELCIADDASTNKNTLSVLRDYIKKDHRIKVVFRDENGHISNSSNSALELANGEWVALLDHDDLLNHHALFWTVDAINENPQAQLIYSDEDKIDGSGTRFEPYFKPDWNLDLLYSQNYFSHLGVYRKQLIDEVGGFRIGFEGSQDYDLLLRCIERIRTQNIHHIPRILYHWRAHTLSTALSSDSKPYASIAGARALNEHFNRMKIKGSVEALHSGYRAHYDLPKILPLVSLVIPTKNAHALVRRCIESIIAKTSYPNYEIILVDNNSDEPKSLKYFDKLASDCVVNLLKYPHTFNYSAINNFAVTKASGEIIGLINNDIEVISPEWLSEMVSLVTQAGVGAVGAKLLYPDGRVQHGGVILGLGGIAGHAHHLISRDEYGYFGRARLISSYSAVTAACLLVKKTHYLQVGGLNDKDLTVAFNDVDFCLKLQEEGYRNIWTPYAELFHYESATRGRDDESVEKIERFNNEIKFMEKNYSRIIARDPAYSQNLSLKIGRDFKLGWPGFNEGGNIYNCIGCAENNMKK